MDLHEFNAFLRRHWIEIAGLFTLAVSLWIAFGPLRHRLPRFLTRLGKYSATLKLLTLSAGCWFLLYARFFRIPGDVGDDGPPADEPSLILGVLLGILGVVLFAGAVFVVTRKQGERVQAPPPPPPAPRLPARLPGGRKSEPTPGA